MNQSSLIGAIRRTYFYYVVVMAIIGLFIVRLFYVQVIQYAHYHAAALHDQLKQYEIPATRGIIEAHEGSSIVPIVLNQKLFTLFADPPLIKKPDVAAAKIAAVIGGNASKYAKLMRTPKTQYVILAYKITQSQSNKILSYHYPGIGTQGQDYRSYPQGNLAAQVLGFVNNQGQGEYGVEQALNGILSGTPGKLKAITDASGVPLVATPGNIDIQPVPGSNVVLTLDMGMQAHLEQILAKDYKSTKSQELSAIIMNPYNGHIKAMANYPTYDPAQYQNVTNPSVFQNDAVDYPIEPGSIMKTLTTSAALNQGVIKPDTTFYDPAHWVINGFDIHDIKIDGGAREQSIQSILSLSLNTGATWMLMQMGNPGGTQITPKGIEVWHNYMVNHFRLGQLTGIQQGYEARGYVPPANLADPSIDLRYANTSFGQGVSITAVQLVSALSSVLNGGTYYRPSLVDQIISPSGKVQTLAPKILEKNVVSPKVGPELIPLMEGVVKSYLHGGFYFMNFPSKYIVGGKTGTAQVAKPTGGYYKNIYNGTYIGFVGGSRPQYTLIVYNIKPNVPGYAGSYGGQPVFADLAHMLINDGYVTPKG